MKDDVPLQPTPPGVPAPVNGVLPLPQVDVQPLSHLLAALELTQLDELTYAAPSLPALLGRLYGGQVLAQAAMAAGATLIDDGDGPRYLHSAHAYFLRPGSADGAVQFRVENLHDGRSFSHRRVHALQHEKPILSMIASFQERQPGQNHQQVMPEVPSPEDCPSNIDLFATIDHPAAKFLSQTGAFDVRHAHADLYMRPAKEARDWQFVWMRSRSALSAGTSQLLQRSLLIFACDQVMLEPVLRRHRLAWMHPGISVASLDHSMWWYRDIDVNDWFLFVQHSPSAQGGRGLGIANIFTKDGTLVASAAQEGMIRTPADDDLAPQQ